MSSAVLSRVSVEIVPDSDQDDAASPGAVHDMSVSNIKSTAHHGHSVPATPVDGASTTRQSSIKREEPDHMDIVNEQSNATPDTDNQDNQGDEPIVVKANEVEDDGEEDDDDDEEDSKQATTGGTRAKANSAKGRTKARGQVCHCPGDLVINSSSPGGPSSILRAGLEVEDLEATGGQKPQLVVQLVKAPQPSLGREPVRQLRQLPRLARVASVATTLPAIS